ncbi:GntR family transcriptional regulator [Microtetraspora niveoalba]|uniref:GntR family transcriptional regulator n=1 Tax=Microtetraspora niveoalba TaxID=46175 RepID=UPI00082AA658|nr:GntR family transcriptional regulator [Microtetraspora niveoalba]
MTEVRGNTRAAYEQIRQAIVEGRYPPGRRLIEQRIAEEFELSRTPVRESLRMLEAEGLVHSEPNRGAVVRSVSVEEVADIYALRALLESFAAELAASRATDEDLARIDEGIALFAAAIEPSARGTLERVRALSEANRRVHGAIIDAARHDQLGQLLARTVEVPLVFQAFRQFDRSELERSHLFHRLIRDAVASGEGARAARLMSEHVLQGRDVLVAHIRAHPQGAEQLFTPPTP